MSYFLISSSEDGDVYVARVTPAGVEEYLREGARFMEKIYTNDPMYWNDANFLLIKGEIVVPKAVEVATRWEIP